MRYRVAGIRCDAEHEGIRVCDQRVELAGGVTFGDIERAAARLDWCKIGTGPTARYLCQG